MARTASNQLALKGSKLQDQYYYKGAGGGRDNDPDNRGSPSTDEQVVSEWGQGRSALQETPTDCGGVP